jgi:hypothetical protein
MEPLAKALRLLNRARATPRRDLDPEKYRRIKAELELRERERRLREVYQVDALSEEDFEQKDTDE